MLLKLIFFYTRGPTGASGLQGPRGSPGDIVSPLYEREGGEGEREGGEGEREGGEGEREGGGRESPGDSLTSLQHAYKMCTKTQLNFGLQILQ